MCLGFWVGALHRPLIFRGRKAREAERAHQGNTNIPCPKRQQEELRISRRQGKAFFPARQVTCYLQWNWTLYILRLPMDHTKMPSLKRWKERKRHDSSSLSWLFPKVGVESLSEASTDFPGSRGEGTLPPRVGAPYRRVQRARPRHLLQLDPNGLEAVPSPSLHPVVMGDSASNSMAPAEALGSMDRALSHITPLPPACLKEKLGRGAMKVQVLGGQDWQLLLPGASSSDSRYFLKTLFLGTGPTYWLQRGLSVWIQPPYKARKPPTTKGRAGVTGSYIHTLHRAGLFPVGTTLWQMAHMDVEL